MNRYKDMWSDYKVRQKVYYSEGPHRTDVAVYSVKCHKLSGEG